MDEDTHLEALADLLKDAEQSIKDEADKEVDVEHCINIKKLCDYRVSCSYGDIVFIICILKDYLKLIEEKEGVIWDYYREQFAKLADRLAVQIEYDYEKRLKKCRNKMGRNTADNDIGEETMALTVNRRKK